MAPLKKGDSKSACSGDRKSDIVPLFGKDLANSKPVILHSIPARVLLQATIKSVWNYLEDISKTENNHHGDLFFREEHSRNWWINWKHQVQLFLDFSKVLSSIT